MAYDELDPSRLEDDDPNDPRTWHPNLPVYVDLLSESKAVEVGKRYSFSLYLSSATPVTLYLRLGVASRAVAVTSTLARFEVSAVATSSSLKVSLAMLEGTYTSLTSLGLTLAWAKLEEGASATIYCEGAYEAPFTVSGTGEVLFTHAPTGALTWTGDYYGTETYEIPTPWADEDLADLRFVQAEDVLILAHPSYPPRWLGRYGHSDWRMMPLAYANGPFKDLNTDSAATVTVSAVTGTSVTLTAGKSIFTEAMLGKQFYLEAKDYPQPWEPGKAVALGDIRYANSCSYKAAAAGTTGTIRPSHKSDSASDGVVVWAYQDNGFGIVRLVTVNGTTATGFVVKQLPASLIATGSPKWASEPWNDASGYPGTVAFHQQRLVFGGTPGYPNTIWASRPGSYLDFGTSDPIQDDDSLSFKFVSNHVNRVTGMISLGSLLSVSGGGTWAIGSDEPLTPSNLSAKLQGFRGAASLEPLGIGNAVVFVQGKVNYIRDLTYEWASQSYNGNNLNVFAPHLVEGYNLKEWAYQESAACIWTVRNDGALLGCTYMRDQEVCGWHRHDTDGTFESVCSVSEGSEDAVYVSVKRWAKRFLERFASRLVTDVRDGWFVDCGLDFDGRNTTDTTITITESGGVYTATASSEVFGTGIEDSEISFFDEVNRTTYRFTPSIGTTTVIPVVPNRTPPADYLNTARTDWAIGKRTFAGLSHLEGKTVSVLADGAVYAEPVIVSGGSITLNRAAYRVIVGLPYTQDIETLGLNVHGEGAIEKKRIVKSIRCLVDETWSIECGGDESRLRPVKVAVSSYDEPAPMKVGLVEKTIDSNWDKQGRVLIRNTNPLPVGIQAILPEIIAGGV